MKKKLRIGKSYLGGGEHSLNSSIAKDTSKPIDPSWSLPGSLVILVQFTEAVRVQIEI